MPEELTKIVGLVEAWYGTFGRRLPWRETPDPYAVTVSEFMLQQTGVETVIPYYKAFLERFPTFHALADASAEDVVAAWEGLGYYRRARSLQALAARVAEGGRLPPGEEALRTLPGVGPYTAAALTVFALHQRAVPVDGNVRRVIGRVLHLEASGKALDAAIRTALAAILPVDPSDFFQGLMDIGATICHPRGPSCPACPLENVCEGKRAGDPERFGRGGTRTPPMPVDVALVALMKEGRLLLKRRETGLLAGLWGLLTIEGPSAPEAPPGIVFRGLRETEVRFRHTFTHRLWRVRTYVAEGDGEGEWVHPEAVGHPLGGPDRRALDRLLERGELCGTERLSS